jgi:AcrR family transcriptional regulator
MSNEHDGVAPAGRDRLLAAVVDYFAQHGVGDASLRQIAAGVGSSHRMLIYHFGSREGLLTAVVEQLENGERRILADILTDDETDRRVLAWQFWTHVADVVRVYGPLYFELASHAMRGDDLGAPLRVPNVEMWVEALSDMWQADGGLGADEAEAHSRLNLAVARGLLHDLLLTGDRAAVDTAMARFDFLCFGTPHPFEPVARLSRTWDVDRMGRGWQESHDRLRARPRGERGGTAPTSSRRPRA